MIISYFQNGRFYLIVRIAFVVMYELEIWNPDLIQLREI